MSRDLEQLLHDTAVRPAQVPDPSELVARGRRRRRRRHAVGALAGAATAVLVGVVALQIVPTGAEPEILDQPPGAVQPAPSESNGDTGRTEPPEELEGESRTAEELLRLAKLRAQIGEIEARIEQLEQEQAALAERRARAVADGADDSLLRNLEVQGASLAAEADAAMAQLRLLNRELEAALAEPPIVERGCGWPAEVGIRADARSSELHSAVLEGDIPEAEAQLRGGVDPNVIDERLAATPLQEAVHSNCVELVELLLDAGADPALVAPGGGSPTALTHAVNVGNPQIVDLLLAAGADPSQWDGGAKVLPPLHEAVGTGRMSLLPRLIDRASDLDVAVTGGDPLATGEDVGIGSALDFAAELGRVQAAALLIEAGATPTRTAVYRAVSAGNTDIVLMLVDAGAPMAAAPSGRTFKDVAVEQGHDDLAEILDRLAR